MPDELDIDDPKIEEPKLEDDITIEGPSWEEPDVEKDLQWPTFDIEEIKIDGI